MTTAIEAWARAPFSEALGWALYHSLWQCVIAALFLVLALVGIRSSRTRYSLACLALVGSLSGFVFTFALRLPGHRMVSGQSASPVLGFRDISGESDLVAATFRAVDLLPWLAPFWIAGVILFQLRSFLGWLAAQRMRKLGVCLAPDYWRKRVTDLGARLSLSRPVLLLETCLAGSPAVIGYWRPVILVPAGLLASMPPNQMEAILLHELAHIRRGDYLVNLLQTMAEGLLYYHPAIWWISSVIRTEREHCCDDIAAAATGGVHEYASALAALEQSRWSFENQQTAAMEAAGGSGLMKRIHRLLYPQRMARRRFAAAPLAIITVGLLAVWQSAATPPQENSQPYVMWLKEDVAYIISHRESDAFQALRSNEERKKFIEQFWLRRDPTPGTPRNEFKEEHYRRIAYSNERFNTASLAGWKTDRGRIYIVYGLPDEVESFPSGRNGEPPSENWLYHHIEGIGDKVIIGYTDEAKDGTYRMLKDPNGKN